MSRTPGLALRACALLLIGLVGTGGASAAAPHANAVKDAQSAPLRGWKALDLARLAQEDSINDALGAAPRRFAVAHEVSLTPDSAGQWQISQDGFAHWRLRLRADEAVHLNLGFSEFRLPAGAMLMIYAIDGSSALGPYTHADELPHGQLWTPILETEEVLLELTVPVAQRKAVRLHLAQIGHGYRGFGHRSKACKSGACNTDVACLSPNDVWRDPARAVGAYTIRGTGLCTGSLLNNTAGDLRMLFATATHCGVRDDEDAAAMLVYWRYESPTCRVPGSSASGTPIARPGERTTAGLRFLAGTPDPFNQPSANATENSDWALVELATPPADNDLDLYWAGWDRRPPPSLCGGAPTAASTLGLCASIHHPNGDEKRITFVEEAMQLGAIEAASGVHFTANWDPTPPLLPGIDNAGGNPLPPSVTEPGSSGSPLYSAQQRLLGVLSGGASFCGAGPEELNDQYGGLFHAWEGLGSVATRMREHLDPTGVNPEFIEGTGGCDAPVVMLSVGDGGAEATVLPGADVLLQAAVNGGTAPYEYRWDVDGDGVVDRSALGLASLLTRYPARGQVSVNLRVIDATGCGRSAGTTLEIAGPELAGSFGTPAQICGNGDAKLDPGEHWRLPFSLDNGGDAAEDALALFSKRVLGEALQGGPDGFGYTFQDSSQPLCGFQFIDLDTLVDELELTPAGEGFPSNDDGRSAILPLGDFAFEAYGQLIEALSMSTNGYLSADPNITGGDFGSSCGVDPDDDAAAFRSNVLHDDLISAGGLRHATFDVCPRPADIGPASQRCAVFQWSGMGRFTSGGNPDGDVSFQAVVYPDSRQIVHQYRGDLPGSNDDADISLYRGPGQARLSYSCDTAVALDQRAVCFFHPDNQPGAADPGGLRLVTPTLALESIGAAGTAMGNVEFQVPADTACGSRYQLLHRGSTYAGGFEPGSALFDIDVADSDVCEVVSSCLLDPPAAIDLNDGAFFDPRRPGNGLVSHLIPYGPPGAPPEFFALWFTGERDRQSSWLVIQGELIDGQVSAPILRFVRDVDSPTWSVSSSEVGQAEVSLLDANQLVLSWRLDGPWRAERMTQLFAASGAEPGTPDHTGAWFHPPESGWGLTVDSFRLDSAEQDYTLAYIYDAAGQPRWSLVQALANDNGLLPALVGQVHCPGCAWLDIDPTLQVAGTLQRRFPSSTDGVISIHLSLPPPLVGDWQRMELPINILTLPRPEAPRVK